MRKLRCIITAAMSALTVISGSMGVGAESYCNTIEYIICDNKAVITGYSGNPEKLSLPSQIEDKPVTEIRENAFYRCETLKSITIPESVNKIGDYAFYKCTNLKSISIDGNIENIPEGMFYGCISLEDVNLPDDTSRIENYAFANCLALNEIKIPEELIIIGAYSFYNCQNLNQVEIPENVKSIGGFALGFKGNETPQAITDFKIQGENISVAKTYATANSINFDKRNSVQEPKNKIPNIIIQIFMAAICITTVIITIKNHINYLNMNLFEII